jgi:hypothetical protein
MRSALCILLGFLYASTLTAAEPCVSGLTPGQRPGPYSSIICTGPQRGQSFCYICDTGSKPAVVVFARTLSEPLGKLVRQFDQAVVQHKNAELTSWVTFLHTDQASLDEKVVAWGRQHAISNIPLGVFEDVVGPPSYRLAADADVTVLLFVKHKVVANFAFRAGELDDTHIAEILKVVPRLVGAR